jgi:uncharacterized protein (TIGR02147 family)
MTYYDATLFRLDKDSVMELISSHCYRDFIKKIISLRSAKGKRFGYADIARKAGFAARSFPRDVAHGQKKLTLQSMTKMIKGMGLSGEIAQFFKYLVEFSHPDCRVKNFTDEQIQKSLSNLKHRLKEKTYLAVPNNDKQDFAFEILNAPIVYAALGEIGIGSTLEEIVARSGLPEANVLAILEKLEESKIVEKNLFQYIAIENHLNFSGLGQSDVFKKFYSNLLQKAQASAEKNFSSDNELHFCSSFSVNKKDIPSLKENLKALLLLYVDQNEVNTGDRVVSLACSLF